MIQTVGKGRQRFSSTEYRARPYARRCGVLEVVGVRELRASGIAELRWMREVVSRRRESAVLYER